VDDAAREAAALAGAALPLAIVNPAQVRHFARAIGKRAKTDPIDAAVIAHFIEATKPNLRPLPDEATRQLSDLVARHNQIQATIVAEQQRKKHRPNPRMLASIERLAAALRKELSDLDGQIRKAIQASPLSRERLLESVPGVGPAIAGRLLAEMPELGSLDRRQVVSLADLAPWKRQSANGKARASSAADAPACAAPCTWGLWSPRNTTPPSRPSTSGLSPPGKKRWSR